MLTYHNFPHHIQNIKKLQDDLTHGSLQKEKTFYT